ncbi:MAG: DUF309 domain-containing protein [Halobacteria archaeon]
MKDVNSNAPDDPDEPPVTDALREGAGLFNDEEFWEAHEVWEDEWHGSVGVNKNFLHGLIQTAAVYVHQKRGNPRGVYSLADTALEYHEDVPDFYRGIDVAGIREVNREARRKGKKALDSDGYPVLKKYVLEIQES